MRYCTNKNCEKPNPQPEENFQRDNTTAGVEGLAKWCRACKSALKHKNYQRKFDKGLCRCGQLRLDKRLRCRRCIDQNRKYQQNLKIEVVLAYGGKCVCCGEERSEFLSIDHIEGQGAKHRQSIGGHFYAWLRKKGFPKDNYRLLCMNCNFALGHFGYCPHQKELTQKGIEQ
jgi:hypothetical protein